ncbi:hypothetical protein Tco_0808727 [Tanacetum coccineum]
MYHNKNVDYVYLLWEDLVYQVENNNSKKNNDMYYPRFTKVIVDYFMAKDQAIPRRNKMFWHYARDDLMFTTIRVISKHQDTQTPKTKSTKKKAKSESSPKTKPTQASKGKRIKTSGKGDKPAKKKQSATKSKGLTVLSDIALTKAKQMKIALKRSKTQQHSSHASSSGADEGTGVIPGVPDVHSYDYEAEQISWKSSDKEDDDDEVNMGNDNDDDVDNQDDVGQEYDEQDDDNQDDDDQEHDGQEDEEQDDVNKKTDSDNDEEIDEEETNEEDEANELYRDVNVNLEGRDTKMTYAPRTIVQTTQVIEDTHLQSDRLRDEAQAENANFINKLDDNIKKIIKDQVKEHVKAQVSKILPKIGKTVNEQLEAEVLTCSSNESKTSHAVATNLSELELKKILIGKMERNKSIHRSDEQKNLYKALIKRIKMKNPPLDQTGGSKKRRAGKEPESTSAPKEKTSKTTGKSTEGSKSNQKSTDKSAQAEEPMQTAKDLEEPAHQEFERGVAKDQPDVETSQLPNCSLAQMEDLRESFDELMDTPLDFSAFVMNRLKVDTLTPELLSGPTFEQMKGSCKSLVELEYFFEEVYKATTNQLDWNNLEGQQYPHDLRKPLPLIPNSQGRRVIPFDHFINNDLAYLSGGVSSRTYTTSVTKTKAAYYGHIKWIEDLVPNTKESAQDVYSKHRIIAVTKLQIVE